MADPLFNGTVLIFAVTLTAASLSFFAEESQRKLKETRRFLWNWLLCIMIFSAAGYTAIISLTEFSPSSISLPICGAVSFVMFLGAGFLNLHLAAVRLACTDSELVAKMLSNEPVELAAEAKTTTEVDGINL